MRSIINIFGLIGLLLFVVGLVMIRNKTTIAGTGFGKHLGEVNEVGGFSIVFFSLFLIGGWYYYNLKK